MTKPDNSAFPERAWPSTRGMTYREWLAGQALVGLSSNMNLRGADSKNYAVWAVGLADALIAELAKEPRP